MELRTYWTIVRRRWLTPVLLPLLVAVVSAVQWQPWQPGPVTYSASMRMLVGVLPLADAAIVHYDPRYFAWLTSEYLVDDFTQVVSSEIFANAINARLAERNIAIPAGMIRASSNTSKQHRIIQLTFSWNDALELRAIAEEAAAALEENAAHYFSQLGTENASIHLLDSPTIVAQEQGMQRRTEWILRILLAVVAGIGLAFLREYLDDTVRGRQDVEEMGIAVLVIIPKP